MVKFVPSFCGDDVKSNAERKVFEILQGLNLEHAYVLHSLGLPRHQSKIYGETDFVIVSELGIACLEIKGGRVETHDGQWIYVDRNGNENSKVEGPFAQATGNMFSLLQDLRSRFWSEVDFGSVVFACGVMFPDIAFTARGAEIIGEIVFDKNTKDITEYINRIFEYWKGRRERDTEELSPKMVDKIANYLRGDFVFVPSLGDRLGDVDRKLLRLTREQGNVLLALSANPRLLIEGGAGTGKTLLAVEYARREYKKGKRVLYLTYNKNLAGDIGKKFESVFGESLCERPESQYWRGTEFLDKQTGSRLTIINIHAFFGQFVLGDSMANVENPNEFFSEILPKEFLKKLKLLPEIEREALRYDVLVMDEGQDLLKPNYLHAVDQVLLGGLEKGQWVVFQDEKQNIYNPESEYAEGMRLLCLYNPVRFRLLVNCRNTVQIARYTARVSREEEELTKGSGSFGESVGFESSEDGFFSEQMVENGDDVREITYSSLNEFISKVTALMREFRRGGVPLNEVVFLSPVRLNKSILDKVGAGRLEVCEMWEGVVKKTTVPAYSTIQGFKGLDAKVVILIDTNRFYRNKSRYLYIGCSRARSLLVVVNRVKREEETQ